MPVAGRDGLAGSKERFFKKESSLCSVDLTTFPSAFLISQFVPRVKTIQNELGTQVLTDFEEALSARGVKVSI